MSDSPKPLTTLERYFIFVDRIIINIENGKLLSKEHVYRILSESLESGTGEIFERALEEQANLLQTNSKLIQVVLHDSINIILVCMYNWTQIILVCCTKLLLVVYLPIY